MKRKTNNIKKQQSHHRVILQGSDHKPHKSVTAIQSEDEEVPDDEEQENIKKMKEKVKHKNKLRKKNLERMYKVQI